jgi:D-3-phosphoglycerate dehydrogenase
LTDVGRFKVVVTDQVFPTVDLERELLASIGAELLVADGTVDGVARLASDADGLLNTYLPLRGETIAGLQRCRIIARYGIGTDNIDVAAASRAGITVTNVPDYGVEEVAAHAVAMMLALLRRLLEADRQVRGGGWGIDGLRPIRRISGLTFGLVGFGRIARRVAATLSALGATVIIHDPFVRAEPGLPKLVSLDELIAASDVISLHAPLTEATRGMFDEANLARTRPGAILVNTSRGPLVVMDDLAAALKSGQLGGAALDVFDTEPVQPGRLDGVPNLLVSPHMAYYSEESLRESQRKAATQVIKVLTGVDPDYPVRT